ncbi:hypothetical protein M4D56_01950 [Cytobacillus oceanisediminis]|uniref:hypothetical protein n=1 Tax=Cytobacillus oceanisediminis TaxID=665099 RepID=UPI00203CECA5|nr:hypothetical protein [Cytobacillus oceanisediminis]MCM3527858.1 hypothetical protein [Cytobacillus oceanisediminis]
MEELNKIVSEANPKLWETFQLATKDISEGHKKSNTKEFSLYRKNRHEELLGLNFPPEYMVFITLVYLKGFHHDYQPMEKILWYIPFRFKEYNCSFSLSKYGYDFKINTKDVEIAKSVLKRLNTSIKIVDKLCSPIIEQLVNKGEITLENRFSLIKGRYNYFRTTAEKLFTRSAPKREKDDSVNILTHFILRHNIESRYYQEASFNAQAMLDAYFSLQEHILVLLLPFSSFDKSAENLSDFISKDWTEKFNRVLKPANDPLVMRHFDKLRTLRERFRNKSAHGDFEKNNGSLYAHFGELGAIPVQMSLFEKGMEYSFVSITDMNFLDICNVIDEFDYFLSTSEKWKKPMSLIISGVDISFDESSIESYQKAMESTEELNEFIEMYFEKINQFSNMDW